MGLPARRRGAELAERLEAVVGQVEDPSWAMFNFHCPPYDSQIDSGPRLDEDLRLRQTAGGIEMHAGREHGLPAR